MTEKKSCNNSMNNEIASLDLRLKKYEQNQQWINDQNSELNKRISLLTDDIYEYRKNDSLFVKCLIGFVIISGVTSLLTLNIIIDGLSKIIQ